MCSTQRVSTFASANKFACFASPISSFSSSKLLCRLFLMEFDRNTNWYQFFFDFCSKKHSNDSKELYSILVNIEHDSLQTIHACFAWGFDKIRTQSPAEFRKWRIGFPL